AQPRLYRRQAGVHVLHLLAVRLARQRVGEAPGRLAVRRHQVLDHLVGRRHVNVAVDVDAQIASTAAIARRAAAAGRGVGAREEHPDLLAGTFGGPILRHNRRPARLSVAEGGAMARKKATKGGAKKKKAGARKARVRDLSTRK